MDESYSTSFGTSLMSETGRWGGTDGVRYIFRDANLLSGMRKEANREIGGPRDGVYRLAGFQQSLSDFLWL